jgi:hypothetical protein
LLAKRARNGIRGHRLAEEAGNSSAKEYTWNMLSTVIKSEGYTNGPVVTQ